MFALGLLLSCVFVFALTGCGTKEDSPDTASYTVTVIGGTGGGEYEEGADCTVTATLLEGEVFVEWTVNGERVSTQNPYTFQVRENVTVTAVTQKQEAEEGDAVSLKKSTGGNPIGGFGVGDNSYDASKDTTSDDLWQKGEKDFYTYGGDPSVFVTDVNGVETAYMYVGHDVSQTGSYNMPEWICYSSTDLLSWKTESIIMDIWDVPWTNTAYDSAWAAQVIEYKGYYWFLFCCWSNTGYAATAGENGDQCIGLAVSDSPTGPFKCYNEPLIYSSWTDNRDDETTGMPRWNDIDPTAYIIDDNGDGAKEFYVAWGNSNLFMAQVEMTESDGKTNGTGCDVILEVVDRSATTDTKNPVTIDRKTQTPCYGGDTNYKDSAIESDWDIIKLDCWRSNPTGNTFTEAPYIYAREVNGRTQYYMIYAAGWREALAYSVSDNLWNVHWTYGNRLMDPTATSNTNHPAVFDFGDSTYMIYHNGSLPYGSGYRRVACIAELEFDFEGWISYVAETSAGLTGVISKITDSFGVPVSHRNYTNPQADPDSSALYPLQVDLLLWDAADLDDPDDMLWEIEEAKYVPDSEDASFYVSIQSYNKAGLYISYDVQTGKVCLTQDALDPATAEAVAVKESMTFMTVAGKDGKGVMFRCVSDANFYLASIDGALAVTDQATPEQRTFYVQTETRNRSGEFAENNGVAVVD